MLSRDAEGGLGMQARQRDGWREDSDAAAEGTGQPALLPRDQREQRRTNERESAPTKHTRKPAPAPSARGGGEGQTARVATHRDGSAFSRGWHGSGRDGTGRVAPAFSGGPAGRPGDWEGAAPGRAGVTPPSSLIRNERGIIYILGSKNPRWLRAS